LRRKKVHYAMQPQALGRSGKKKKKETFVLFVCRVRRSKTEGREKVNKEEKEKTVRGVDSSEKEEVWQSGPDRIASRFTLKLKRGHTSKQHQELMPRSISPGDGTSNEGKGENAV